MQENIINQYSAELEIQENKDSAKDIHDYFVKKIANATGIYESYEKQPEKYVHFIRLGKFLGEHGWDYIKFIDAQFESLAWCNGLPEPSQMYSDKAIERYNKYLYKNKNKQSLEEPQVEGSLWAKIK